MTRETEIPFVGAVTLLTQTSAHRIAISFTIAWRGSPARALTNFAANRPELKTARVAIVHAENEIAVAAPLQSKIRP